MAAKTKISSVISFNKKPRKKRPGVHAKSKTSKIKTSKNYIKLYTSQGK